MGDLRLGSAILRAVRMKECIVKGFRISHFGTLKSCHIAACLCERMGWYVTKFFYAPDQIASY
jgi:hypothetical protein